MKRILILILCFVGFRTFAQVPFEMGAIKVDSLYMNETSNWWSGFSTDATFATPSDKKVASQKATSTYIAAQIAAITAGITDTAEVIRLIGSYLDTTNIVITANYDAVGDTLFTIFNGDYGYAVSFKSAHQDSLNAHTDSLQSHNTRINAVKTINTTQGDTLTSHNTRIKTVLTSTTTATSTNVTQGDTLTSHNTRINAIKTSLAIIKDSVEVQLVVDNDTLPSAEYPTGDILVIGRRLAGYNLTKATAYVSVAGDGIAYLSVYRHRGGSSVNMTSGSASVTAAARVNATINTTYDDLAEGDWISCKYYDTGSPVSEIMNVVLIFKKP
jgi:hypothetical protein